MNFKGSHRLRLWLAGFWAGLFSVVMFTGALHAQVTDRKEILRQARQAYYSLKDEGLAQFQCRMAPNWQLVLTERKLEPDQINRALMLLNKINFSVSLAVDGEAKVTHNDVAAENEETAKGLNQIYGGMEQAIVGFFQTWSAFSMSPALPAIGDDYQLEKAESEYHLSYKNGTTDVVTIFDQDFAIRYMKITNPEFDATMRPQFAKTAKGWLVTGYSATYAGKSVADTVELLVAINYQAVDGLQLPQTLRVRGSYGGSPFDVEITFSGCHATRR